jgi:hypothetical protein
MTMPNGDQGDNGQQQQGGEPGGDEGQQQPTASEWKPPASQEELDRIVQDRLKRETRKYRDYDSLKAKAEQYDTLAASVQTDQERALAEAQEQAFNAAMGSVVPRLVRAEFRAASLGKLTSDQLEALIEDVDLTKYVDDDGEPDIERIKRKVDAFALQQRTRHGAGSCFLPSLKERYSHAEQQHHQPGRCPGPDAGGGQQRAAPHRRRAVRRAEPVPPDPRRSPAGPPARPVGPPDRLLRRR